MMKRGAVGWGRGFWRGDPVLVTASSRWLYLLVAGTKPKYELAPMKCFREFRGRLTFDASYAHEAPKSVAVVPVLVVLAVEVMCQVVELSINDLFRQRDVHVWRPQVPFVLRDLVLEQDVVTPRVPGKPGDGLVVLVPIVEAVCNYHVWPTS